MKFEEARVESVKCTLVQGRLENSKLTKKFAQ